MLELSEKTLLGFQLGWRGWRDWGKRGGLKERDEEEGTVQKGRAKEESGLKERDEEGGKV